jgi:hypothetical protein
MSDAPSQKGEPYCGNCGYVLTGATESSKCPECGRPLVEVLMRPVFQAKGGTRWTSHVRVFDMPLVHIAFGAREDEPQGRAKGFIAIGDIATGVVAIGGQARGLVAFGGMALGGFTFGGMSLGLFTAIGGMTIGGTALGGFAIGGLAQGGGAIGYVAQGGMAIGHYARGGGAFGTHVIGPGRGASQAAQDMFNNLSWFFGSGAINISSLLSIIGTALTPALVTLFVCALIALWSIGRHKGAAGPGRFEP